MNVEGLGSLQLCISLVSTGDELGTQSLSVGTLDPHLPYIEVTLMLVTRNNFDPIALLAPKCTEHPEQTGCCLAKIEPLRQVNTFKLTIHFPKPTHDQDSNPDAVSIVFSAGTCLSELL